MDYYLTRYATAIFKNIISGLDDNTEYCKLDNSPDWVPISVDRLYSSADELITVFALAMNTSLNGDNMASPDCGFAYFKDIDKVAPLHYQDDWESFYIETASVKNGKLEIIDEKAHYWVLELCGYWLSSINLEQGLGVKIADCRSPS